MIAPIRPAEFDIALPPTVHMHQQDGFHRQVTLDRGTVHQAKRTTRNQLIALKTVHVSGDVQVRLHAVRADLRKMSPPVSVKEKHKRRHEEHCDEQWDRQCQCGRIEEHSAQDRKGI